MSKLLVELCLISYSANKAGTSALSLFLSPYSIFVLLSCSAPLLLNQRKVLQTPTHAWKLKLEGFVRHPISFGWLRLSRYGCHALSSVHYFHVLYSLDSLDSSPTLGGHAHCFLSSSRK